MKKSKWFVWSFIPFINFAAWVHAAIRTGRNACYWLAAIYALPFTAALVMGMVEESLGLSKQTIETENDWGGSAAAALWIAGMIHVLLKKDAVDQQIQAHDVGKAQVALATLDSALQSSDRIHVPSVATIQPRAREMPKPPSASQPPALGIAASDLHREQTICSDQPSPAGVMMKGTILDYSIQKSEGIISGDDNNRYKFAGAEWKASDAPARGQRVDFDVANGRAIEIYREMAKAIIESRTEQPSEVDLKGLPPYYQEEFKKIWESGEVYKGKWNWAAFLFGGFWALTKGIWLSAVISLGLCFFGGIGIIYWFIFGFRGNYIYYTLHTKKKQLPA